jgi:hypothetical protein
MLFAEFNPLNDSPLISPALQCFHIAGLVMSIGTIAVADFRVLGLGMRRNNAAGIAKDLALWTTSGLAVAILSGSLLFLSDPDEYYLNRSFQIKMTLLLAALIFHYTGHDRVIRSDTAWGKVGACISLALWVGVIAGGIFIGFA